MMLLSFLFIGTDNVDLENNFVTCYGCNLQYGLGFKDEFVDVKQEKFIALYYQI
jgi:hypothetical protein